MAECGEIDWPLLSLGTGLPEGHSGRLGTVRPWAILLDGSLERKNFGEHGQTVPCLACGRHRLCRAAVSHAAPAHHFASIDDLLAEIATRGYHELTAAMDEFAAF